MKGDMFAVGDRVEHTLNPGDTGTVTDVVPTRGDDAYRVDWDEGKEPTNLYNASVLRKR